MGKNHPNVDDYVISRVRALESLLLEKGLLAPDAVDRVIRRYEASTGPMLGARAVARAWRDPAYKTRLLQDSPAALGDFGVSYDRLVVVENTPAATTWSSARCARATRGTSWACRPPGTRCPPIGRAP